MKIIKNKLRPFIVFFLDDVRITRISFAYFKMKYYIWIKRHFYKKEFEPLKSFKNAYRGKRIFMVATGPSLTIEDVDKLKGEYTFGINSVIKLYDKTDWRPTFYGICDGSVYSRIKDDLNNLITNEIAFYNHFGIKWDYKNAHPVPTRATWCTNEDLKALHLKPSTPYGETSGDITKYVYAGSNVVHFCMQICFYMGFSEIYLLGTDCTDTTKHSTFATYANSSVRENDPVDVHNWMLADYASDKKYAEAHGIRIYNATRGGDLELFERVDLDTIVGNKDNNK